MVACPRTHTRKKTKIMSDNNDDDDPLVKGERRHSITATDDDDHDGGDGGGDSSAQKNIRSYLTVSEMVDDSVLEKVTAWKLEVEEEKKRKAAAGRASSPKKKRKRRARRPHNAEQCCICWKWSVSVHKVHCGACGLHGYICKADLHNGGGVGGLSSQCLEKWYENHHRWRIRCKW